MLSDQERKPNNAITQQKSDTLQIWCVVFRGMRIFQDSWSAENNTIQNVS